jgi:hypothetical protein
MSMFAALQFGDDIGGPQAVMRERDHAVEPEVRDLADQLGAIAAVVDVLGRHHDLGGLLADLLEEGVGALVQQARDIARVGVAPVGGLAAFDHAGQARQGVDCVHFAHL